MTLIACLLAALPGLLTQAGPRTPPPDALVSREAWVMGTRLRVRVRAADRDVALAATEAALAEIERIERLLSTWDEGSEMSALNAAPLGAPAEPGRELMALLAEAEAWAERTGRAFEPAVGALVDAWDLRGEGRLPGPAELAVALRASGPAGMRVLPGAGVVVRRAPRAWIDTGAFGKGAALRAAADTLRARAIASALLDLGGQVLAIGRDGGREAGWTLAVAHPARRGEPVATLRIRDASVATSGTSERWVEIGDGRLGHILDPRTGRPAPSRGSVTVVSADALAADALATALYVMGPDKGMAWARDRTDVGVLFLIEGPDGLDARWNGAMESLLTSAPGLSGRVP